MTSHQIAAVVACRVLGLYTAIYWLVLLPVWAFDQFRGIPTFSWAPLGAIFLFVVPAALAVILWRLAPWIAKKMLADAEVAQASPSTITLAEVQVVAVSILGLFFIIKALPQIAVMILNYFEIPERLADESIQSLARNSTLKMVIMRFTELGLGLWLFFGANSFVGVMQRICSPKCEPEA